MSKDKKAYPAFIDYVNEDFSKYPLAKDTLNPLTGEDYVDPDEDFLIGNSGGFLMKMDFIFIDTWKYSETAQYFEQHKIYTHHPKGSFKYQQFWKEEGKRRRLGLVRNCKLLKKDIPKYLAASSKEEAESYLKPLRITGDHYNYLNYGRIERTLTDKEKEEAAKKGNKSKTVVGFPRFWDGDYWNFKTDEFVAKNDYHLCKGKARRKGYSFKRGSQAANTMNINPNILVILAAYEEKYLTDTGATADMVKKNLDWYHDNTYWWRGFVSEDLEDIQLGIKPRRGHAKKGYLSRCRAVSCKVNTSAAAGKGALEVDFEEAGIFPNLDEVVDITLSTTEAGALSRGTIRIYGTAGTKEANWKAFRNYYYRPHATKMMPFENVWDHNRRNTVCGFFHPQIWNLEPYMDEHGNSDLEAAWKWDKEDKERARQEKTDEGYRNYVAQRANSPAEAFDKGVENLFSSIDLDEHVSYMSSDEVVKWWRDGQLYTDSSGGVSFKTNQQIEHDGGKAHPYIEDFPFNPKGDLHGCIREYHPPFKVDGEVPSNLYYVIYDTVSKDKDNKTLTTKNSLNAMYVLMFPNDMRNSNSTGDIIVASYIGRPSEMEDADRIFLYLCEYYNAKGLPEVNVGTVVKNFKSWGKLHRLYRDPRSITHKTGKENLNAPFGMIIGDGNTADEAHMYLKDMLYTKTGVDEDGNRKFILHYINDIGLLKELQNFNKDDNFDRISALRLAPYIRNAFLATKKKPKAIGSKSIFSEIGLYNKT